MLQAEGSGRSNSKGDKGGGGGGGTYRHGGVKEPRPRAPLLVVRQRRTYRQ